jgi:multiple RNA-binding domain-containing protein 1
MEQEVKAEEKKLDKKKSKAREIKSPIKITKPSPEEDVGEEKPKDEAVSDVDYFRSRVKRNWSDAESESDSESESHSESESNKELESEMESESEPDTEKESEKELELELELESEPDLKHAESDGGEKSCSYSEDPSDVRKLVLDTGRLFVRNLPYTTT